MLQVLLQYVQLLPHNRQTVCLYFAYSEGGKHQEISEYIWVGHSIYQSPSRREKGLLHLPLEREGSYAYK